jgi:hypothetical protein
MNKANRYLRMSIHISPFQSEVQGNDVKRLGGLVVIAGDSVIWQPLPPILVG